MKFNQGNVYQISKWCLFAFLLVGLGGSFFGFGIWALVEGKLVGLFFLLWAFVWLYFMASAFYPMASVTISETGVSVCVFVKTKQYGWNEIQQAGVIWRRMKYSHVNELILLPKTGIPGNPQDKFYMLQNQFHLIYLPCTPEVVSFVCSHYGPLDFDYSDGKGMQKR